MMKYLYTIVGLVILASLLSCKTETNAEKNKPTLDHDLRLSYDQNLFPFYHGVASGDPTQTSVVLWAKVTDENVIGEIEVGWQISPDNRFKKTVSSGVLKTGPENNYVAKVNVEGLRPNRKYYYKFNYNGNSSIKGTTRTLPRSTNEIKLAIASCSNYEAGYFNAYNTLAYSKDINTVVHLGDYIYEYARGVYGDKDLEKRKHMPPHEIVSLQDYRTRYSQYRLDKDLLMLHSRHPFISIWDDHEIANNAFVDGAENHQAEEGDYQDRKMAAKKAYYEWMPINLKEDGQLYRSFDYGNLLKLIMLDERLAGRTAPAESMEDPNLENEERSMLGAKQMAWLKSEISNSEAKWIVIGNQVMLSDYVRNEKGDRNMDAWDGYPKEKKELIQFLEGFKDKKNIIFVTGDTHTSWATEIPTSGEAYAEDSNNSVGVEFGVQSITSANYDEGNGTDYAKEKEALAKSLNPHLKYTNFRDHGYLLLTLSNEEAKAEYVQFSNIEEPLPEVSGRKTIKLKSGSRSLILN
jgi:alkaline phosphatase D